VLIYFYWAYLFCEAMNRKGLVMSDSARRLILIASTALFLSACSGSEETTQKIGSVPPQSLSGAPIPPAPPPPPPEEPRDTGPADTSFTKIRNKRDSTLFLSRATFGGTKAQVNNLRGTDAVDFLRSEFAKPASLTLPKVLAVPRNENGNLPGSAASDVYWDQIITADDQLRQRMAFALSQIVVYSDIAVADSSQRAYYQDILIRNAFGNYRDLLQDVTYSPAMANWLTYLRNQKGDPRTGRMPDENYAREVLQLFSIGLFEMYPDGSPRLDAQGKEIPTYDNDDIVGLARVFTGLSYDVGPGSSFWDNSEEANRRPLKMFPDRHSELEKTFLGTTIPAGTDGDESIDRALDTIFDHPNLAPFLARQLIQRFTESNPDPSYIRRVAQAFERGTYTTNTGERFGSTGRGDLEATLAAILLDESLYLDRADEPQTVTRGKVREPILRFTHWARAFNVNNVVSSNEARLTMTVDPVNALGQHPIRSPSVFNFYRPGYIAPGTLTGDRNMTAPEFQIVNESTAIGYLNFMSDFTFDRTPQRDAALQSFLPDYTDELALVDDPKQLVRHLDILLTGQRMPSREINEIVRILLDMPISEGSPEDAAADRLQKV
jgi:uncharacterized protein (DUF1800 family)